MYFSKLDRIKYNGKQAVNITNSILLKYKTMNNSTLWNYHTVVDGETPEIVAYKYYGNPNDHWVILLVNGIINPFFNWVMSGQEVVDDVKARYGVDRINKVHHLFNLNTKRIVDEVEQAKYVDSTGTIFGALPAHYSAVSNLEYEIQKNDERRDIKILAPKYLQDFKNQFEDLMNREGLK